MTPREAFRRACELDVAVRKPGNVSIASPGHRMDATMFVRSAEAAAGPLFMPGASVGARIEGAVDATWDAVGCNTNLGIVLLAAPLAAAAERPGALASAAALQRALRQVLDRLGIDDASAAFRAIVRANPAGLGESREADVRAAPQSTLLEAMRVAAARDSIARQYAEGFADLFELAPISGFARIPDGDGTECEALVQRLFVDCLARWPDSHIVRKHGEPVAHIVMAAAQGWRDRKHPGADPDFAAWDESLKRQRLNPGTSADLTVAALMIAAMLPARDGVWHGS